MCISSYPRSSRLNLGQATSSTHHMTRHPHGTVHQRAEEGAPYRTATDRRLDVGATRSSGGIVIGTLTTRPRPSWPARGVTAAWCGAVGVMRRAGVRSKTSGQRAGSPVAPCRSGRLAAGSRSRTARKVMSDRGFERHSQGRHERRASASGGWSRTMDLCEVCPGAGGVRAVGICNGCGRMACQHHLVATAAIWGAGFGARLVAWYGESVTAVEVDIDTRFSHLVADAKRAAKRAYAEAWAEGTALCTDCREASASKAR